MSEGHSGHSAGAEMSSAMRTSNSNDPQHHGAHWHERKRHCSWVNRSSRDSTILSERSNEPQNCRMQNKQGWRTILRPQSHGAVAIPAGGQRTRERAASHRSQERDKRKARLKKVATQQGMVLRLGTRFATSAKAFRKEQESERRGDAPYYVVKQSGSEFRAQNCPHDDWPERKIPKKEAVEATTNS